MDEEKFIIDFLHKFIKEDNPIIYIYIMGKRRSKETAINKTLAKIYCIFVPAITKDNLQKYVTNFLNLMEENYKNGKIKIKSIY
jgi:hypothetical protein